MDRAIDKAIERAEIPGAVVLARMPRDGELIEHCSVRGLAVVRPERIPMTRDTIFDLASLTKAIATTSALLLARARRRARARRAGREVPARVRRARQGSASRCATCSRTRSGLKPWRAFHELLLERERKTGERWLATPAARES